MAVNSRITSPSGAAPAVVTPPPGVITPPTSGVVLLDGAGNILKTVDNLDGTATIATAASAPAVGIALTGAPPATQTVYSGACVYRGIDVRETGGAASVSVTVYPDVTATGAPVVNVNLSPGESRSEDLVAGRVCAAGMHAVIAGTGVITGTVFRSA